MKVKKIEIHFGRIGNPAAAELLADAINAFATPFPSIEGFGEETGSLFSVRWGQSPPTSITELLEENSKGQWKGTVEIGADIAGSYYIPKLVVRPYVGDRWMEIHSNSFRFPKETEWSLGISTNLLAGVKLVFNYERRPSARAVRALLNFLSDFPDRRRGYRVTIILDDGRELSSVGVDYEDYRSFVSSATSEEAV